MLRKHYSVHTALRWRGLLRRSRAQREFENLLLFERCGVPCVRALDWREERRLGCVVDSELVTSLLVGARDLRTELSLRPEPRRRRALVEALGRLLRRLHDAGLCSTTASPRNVLVAPANGDGSPDLAFCDQPFATRVGHGWLGRRLQQRDLHDALFSPHRRKEWSSTERWRGVVAYHDGDEQKARRTWRRSSRRFRWSLLLDRALARLLAQLPRRNHTEAP